MKTSYCAIVLSFTLVGCGAGNNVPENDTRMPPPLMTSVPVSSVQETPASVNPSVPSAGENKGNVVQCVSGC
jgi:uncharacterized protein YcfL